MIYLLFLFFLILPETQASRRHDGFTAGPEIELHQDQYGHFPLIVGIQKGVICPVTQVLPRNDYQNIARISSSTLTQEGFPYLAERLLKQWQLPEDLTKQEIDSALSSLFAGMEWIAHPARYSPQLSTVDSSDSMGQLINHMGCFWKTCQKLCHSTPFWTSKGPLAGKSKYPKINRFAPHIPSQVHRQLMPCFSEEQKQDFCSCLETLLPEKVVSLKAVLQHMQDTYPQWKISSPLLSSVHNDIAIFVPSGHLALDVQLTVAVPPAVFSSTQIYDLCHGSQAIIRQEGDPQFTTTNSDAWKRYDIKLASLREQEKNLYPRRHTAQDCSEESYDGLEAFFSPFYAADAIKSLEIFGDKDFCPVLRRGGSESILSFFLTQHNKCVEPEFADDPWLTTVIWNGATHRTLPVEVRHMPGSRGAPRSTFHMSDLDAVIASINEVLSRTEAMWYNCDLDQTSRSS